MLTRILSFHQVMPCYLDFISVFGAQKFARELRFSGFREWISLDATLPACAAPTLGRSGYQYQLCYNLKAPASIRDGVTNNWSIRQAAFHHQFDVKVGTTLWIIAKGNWELKDRIQHLTGVTGSDVARGLQTVEQCFNASLAIHLLCCHWCIEDWRWYIQYLEDTIDEEVRPGIYVL